MGIVLKGKKETRKSRVQLVPSMGKQGTACTGVNNLQWAYAWITSNHVTQSRIIEVKSFEYLHIDNKT